ncbi:MAG TPA: G5 domain-containing protein [Acidimicrobiia bacterium]|nr:G5 domain-containing protein [Acidimicrobiia bacterium]
MPPTSTDTRRHPFRALSGRFGVAAVAVVLAVPVAGVAALRSSSKSSSSTLRSAALAARVGADRLDRASRSAVRDEPAPIENRVVTVIHDGRHQEVSSSAATVGDMLSVIGVAVDDDDEVTPALTAPLADTVTIVRVDVSLVTEERAVPVPKELHDDPALAKGETRVEADGAPGVERVVFEVTRRDGKVVSKRPVSTQTVTAAQPRVVIVGRGGGRGTPAGDEEIPFKLRVANGDADPDHPGGAAAGGPPNGSQMGGASWYRYKPGTCAHRTLPKGTVVKVTNLDNGQTTTCTVADRGPFVAGRIIDLDRSVFMAIASSPGQGVMRVRIEW